MHLLLVSMGYMVYDSQILYQISDLDITAQHLKGQRWGTRGGTEGDCMNNLRISTACLARIYFETMYSSFQSFVLPNFFWYLNAFIIFNDKFLIILGDKGNIVFPQEWMIIVSEFISTSCIVGGSVISSSRDRERTLHSVSCCPPTPLSCEDYSHLSCYAVYLFSYYWNSTATFPLFYMQFFLINFR